MKRNEFVSTLAASEEHEARMSQVNPLAIIVHIRSSYLKSEMEILMLPIERIW